MKITFVTGAANGLGKEFAVLYGKDGNNLLLVDIDKEALSSVKNELSLLYPDIFIDTFVADLAKEEELKKVFAYTLEKGYFVNNVVNAAGFGDRCEGATAVEPKSSIPAALQPAFRRTKADGADRQSLGSDTGSLSVR